MRVYKIIDGLAQVFSVVFNDKVVNAFQYFKNQVRWYGKKRKFRRVGNNVHLEFPAKILTPDKIEIGDNVFIAENAILEVWGDNPDACISIGNNVCISSRIHIGCINKVTIASGVLIAGILSVEILFSTLGINWIYNIYEDFLFITIRTLCFQIISLIATFAFVRNTNDLMKYVLIVAFSSSGANVVNFLVARKKYCKFRFTFHCNWKEHLKPILVIFSTTVGIECEPVRVDDYTGKKMTFFHDPDGLPLELHE